LPYWGEGLANGIKWSNPNGAIMDNSQIISILSVAIATATPLVFATIGETITERAGVINLSAEGTILLAAMVGFAVSGLVYCWVLGRRR
jgi:ABC-type uncharacterized transport system permease subunit